MENLNNVDEPNKKPHPKPTDDPGAEIETVTPDSQQGSLPNDQCIPSEDTKEESVTDANVKESSTPKSQENNSGSEKAPDETEEEQENDVEIEDKTSKNPGVNKDENDGTGIETVTPT